MNTKKLFTILSLVIGSSTLVKGVCWSKDYPCCKQEIDINTVAIYQDPDTKHYYSNEDGHICAVVVGDQDKCPSGDVYPCCKTCDVVYSDQEDWGVEDEKWCSIPFSCNPTPTRTTLSLPPIVVTPGTEVCSLENEPCGGSLYENTVSGCCEEGLVCYKRSSFYHYCVSQDLFEDFQQPTEVVTSTTTTTSGKATGTPTSTTTSIIPQQTNNPYFFPPPPPPPPRFYGNFGPNFNPNCSRPYDYCGIEGYPDCCQQGFICTMNAQEFKQCLEDPEQVQVYAIGQGGNYFYPPPPPPYYPPPYNPQQGQPVHGEGNPGDMYPYNPPPYYPPPNYPPPNYPPPNYPPPNYPPPQGGRYPPPYYPPPYYPPPYIPANVTTTTTEKPKPTTCAKAYYPCGGVDFPDAPNCCQEGYYCNTDNPDFFVCKEIELVTVTTTEPPAPTETPAEKCAAVFGMCGGSKFKDVPTCCQTGSYCLKVSAEYYQCIPNEYKEKFSDYDVKKTTTVAAQKTTTAAAQKTTTAAAQKTTTTAAAQKTTTTAAAAKTTTTAAAAKTTTTAAAAKTTTTAAAAKTTAASTSDGECAKVYEACGGVNHTGPTCCEPGTKCIAFNQYHHQCIPEDAEGYEDFI